MLLLKLRGKSFYNNTVPPAAVSGPFFSTKIVSVPRRIRLLSEANRVIVQLAYSLVGSSTVNRLLIIACCQRKNPSLGLLPAIERYDGPTFRVLRKFFREVEQNVPRILILSAKYGLLCVSELIPDYDCHLTPSTAKRLRPGVLAKLRKELRSSPVNTVGLCLGREYEQVITGFETDLPTGASIEHLGGGLGRRLTELRDWLRDAGDTERDKNKIQ